MQNSSRNYFGWKWLLFLIVIAAELYYMFEYANSYGALSLIALILGSIVLGIILMRWEGDICWKRILYMERNNISTTNEMRDGVLILFAGILMIIPGIITSALGLLLFLPPIRWIVRMIFLRNLYFEIPEGMGSQFQMFAFTTSSPKNEPQNDSPDDSENVSQDDYADSYNDSFNQNPDVQIIDVKATNPKQSPPNSENMLEKQSDSDSKNTGEK